MAAVPKASQVNVLADYEWQKARWIKEHPNATPREYEQFIQWLCKRLGL